MDTSNNVNIIKNSTNIGDILNNILDGIPILKDTSSNNIDNKVVSDEKFWINDPIILFKEGKLFTIWPTENMSKNEKLNTLSRLVIYITIISFIFTYSFKILISGVVTLGVFVFLYYTSNNSEKETFQNFSSIDNFYRSSDITDRFTMPTNNNPMMNVMLPEIKDDPDRNMAAPSYNPVISQDINNSTKEMIIDNFDEENTYDKKNIEDKLFKDLGDNFQFEQSMRNFYATANTTIPNNQGEFANFCYGDMISCKEGNKIACGRHNPNHINI